MPFICIYDEQVSSPSHSLKAAWESLKESCRDDLEIDDCSFYEVGEPIEVVVEIRRKEVKEVLKINGAKK